MIFVKKDRTGRVFKRFEFFLFSFDPLIFRNGFIIFIMDSITVTIFKLDNDPLKHVYRGKKEKKKKKRYFEK